MEERIYEFLRQIHPTAWIFFPIILIITIVYIRKTIIGLGKKIFKKSDENKSRKWFTLNRGHIVLGSILLEIILGAGMIIPTFLFLGKTKIGIELVLLSIVVAIATFIIITSPSNKRRLLMLTGLIVLIIIIYVLMPNVFSQLKSQVLLFFLFIIELLILLLLAFLIIYFWWAPDNIFFTFVPEGRAKIIVKAHEFKKAIISWKDHVIVTPNNKDSFPSNKEWDVVDGDPKKGWFGGLYFYGLWPLEDIYLYDFSWTNMKQNGEIHYHEPKELDYILLKEDVYLGCVDKAEDKAMLPVDVKFVLTMRVINPFKALFNVENWLEAIMNRVRAAVRNALTENTYDEWISEDKDLAKKIEKKLESFFIDECQGHYGIEVRAIEVTDINPSIISPEDEIRHATIKKFLGKMEAERIAKEISNTVISMMSSVNNLTFEQMQEKISNEPKLKTRYENYCLKRFTDKMAAETGSWVKVDTSGSSGRKKDLLDLFASVLRMPKGNKPNTEEGQEQDQNTTEEESD